MITNSTKPNVNNYWNMVKHLSPEAKIDLITMLSQSLKTTKSKTVPASKYYGVWGDDGMTVEEFVGDLKSLRTFKKDIIEL